MERRAFLRKSSIVAASLMLPGRLRAQNRGIASNADALIELEDKALTTIAFGSCNDIRKEMSYWPLVGQENPDLWIWMGDNIYADLTSITERKRRYDFLKDFRPYQELRAKAPVIGTWDDHDFGYNNCDGSFWSREQSQALFCDFMDIGKTSDLRLKDGVYQSYTFGPAGQKTQVILLDLRYNMDQSRNDRVLLGETQWQWLTRELKNSTADLLLIGSSLAVTSNISLLGLEGWASYAKERARLYEALASTAIPTLLLSGDRHYSEITRTTLPSGKVVHEFMSSGLTHSTEVSVPHAGRLGKPVGKKSYGLLTIDWSGVSPVVGMAMKSCERYAVLGEARMLADP